jgi:hypothetical protein
MQSFALAVQIYNQEEGATILSLWNASCEGYEFLSTIISLNVLFIKYAKVTPLEVSLNHISYNSVLSYKRVWEKLSSNICLNIGAVFREF